MSSYSSSSQGSSSSQENDTIKQSQDHPILPVKSRQAFNMTTMTLPPQFSIPTLMIDKAKSAYALKETLFDPYAIPTFLLLFLGFNPDVMLPLSSLREPVLEGTLQLIEDLLYPNPSIDGPADLIPTLLHSIVCGRVSEIASRMYPHYKEWRRYNRYGPRPSRPFIHHLEKGPIPALQSVIEDSMVVYNPIKVLISFLRAMVAKYRSLDLPMEQNELAGILLNEDVTFWLYAASTLSFAYGLFMWDSTGWGVSDAEWDSLVQCMTIITTEIFPNAYERISTIEYDGSNYVRSTGGAMSYCDETLNDVIKKILIVITPCFLHHYRPMKNQFIPHLGDHRVMVFEHYFTSPKYIDGVKKFPTILHNCTKEYLRNPSTFQEILATGVSINPSDVMSKCSKFLAEYCFDVKELKKDNPEQTLRWKMPYMKYNNNTGPYTYLADYVLRHPPVNDPVYQRIASIFPKNMKSSNVIYPYRDEKENPQFTCPP